jgi:hypothetical protein
MSTTQSVLGQSELSGRVNKLMQEYKGSKRYYKTNRGYAMVAAKLEDDGYKSDDVDLAINEHIPRKED